MFQQTFSKRPTAFRNGELISHNRSDEVSVSDAKQRSAALRLAQTVQQIEDLYSKLERNKPIPPLHPVAFLLTRENLGMRAILDAYTDRVTRESVKVGEVVVRLGAGTKALKNPTESEQQLLERACTVQFTQERLAKTPATIARAIKGAAQWAKEPAKQGTDLPIHSRVVIKALLTVLGYKKLLLSEIPFRSAELLSVFDCAVAHQEVCNFIKLSLALGAITVSGPAAKAHPHFVDTVQKLHYRLTQCQPTSQNHATLQILSPGISGNSSMIIRKELSLKAAAIAVEQLCHLVDRAKRSSR